MSYHLYIECIYYKVNQIIVSHIIVSHIKTSGQIFTFSMHLLHHNCSDPLTIGQYSFYFNMILKVFIFITFNFITLLIQYALLIIL